MIQRFISDNFNSLLSCQSLPRLAHICVVQETDTWPRILHRHQSYSELVFILKGRLSVMLDDVCYEAGKNDLIVYNSGLLHDERPYGDCAFRSFVCGVTGFELPGYPRNWLPVGNTPVINMGGQAPYVEKIFQLILDAELSGEFGANIGEVSQYLLCSLITILLSAVKNVPAGNCGEAANFSLGQRIKSFIDEHYADNISLASISESLRISRFYMAHVFREETGYSPVSYIINRRMGEAQNLLIQTELPIRIISQMVGYENTDYFNQLFKKHTGISPGKFRKISNHENN